ncbi:MAG: hypothetical protein A2Y18_04265 [Clostridiales bacterium GWD2_32_19]|nr:MAG: hypothetical protein A2Y18_04265 [Clostridiales bacterium GWD2_32_19]
MKSRSFSDYIFGAKHIGATLGQLPIRSLGKMDYETFINDFIQKQHTVKGEKRYYSQSRLHNVYMVLRIVVRYAYEEDIILKNYMENIKEPFGNAPITDKYKALKDDEIAEIIIAVNDNLALKALILILRDTGIRPGEALALTFENVDLDNCKVRIEQALSYDIKFDIETKKELSQVPIIKELKNERGKVSLVARRTLNITQEASQAARDWKSAIESNKKLMAKRTANHTENMLFTGQDGTLKMEEYHAKQFSGALKRKGLSEKGYIFYRFRHTFCTNLVQMGIDITTIAKLMGDATLDMILEVYNNINKEDIDQASNKYIERLGNLSDNKEMNKQKVD